MMVAMVRRPPEHAFLSRAFRQEGHAKLPETIHTIAAVAEIAMVAGGNGEHPDIIEPDDPQQIAGLERKKQGKERTQVK